ncbi:Retrovirus-related Pol polyprotein from transposon RE2 [Vitis vinifera]|uniref:Retrovirus-related Pol polyprotein from transposon RE2 n=1 Tax=Vitis vinifera TaxID=29760 RepID=A0A438G5Y9_VITVI|nr:Retrovirus-related Pol polyprotein from transposon RE2 [Vitis vinifera]
MTTKNQIFTSVISGSPMITSEKLVGSENYLSWSASVELWFMVKDMRITWLPRRQISLRLTAYSGGSRCTAKGLYTNDIQRLYKVLLAIVHLSQQDWTYLLILVRLPLLRSSSLTVMPLTPDVGAQQTQLDKFFMVLTLMASVRILSLFVIRFWQFISSFLKLPLEEDAVVPEVEANVLNAPIAIKLGHTRDRCYQLHGRPPRTAHMAQSSDSLLPQPPSSSASQTSQASIASVAQPDLFSSITTTSDLPTVTLANGSQTVAKGPEYGKTIGIGRESQGLYHLTSDSSPAVCISTDAPLLIHNRLGHPSLSKFQKMVPRFSTLSSLPLTMPGIFFSPIYFVYVSSWILHQSSCAHTPQQNGVAERKNRHLVETALLSSSIVTFLFAFGGTLFLPLDKLSAKAMKCLFLGYSRLQKGYRCYSLETHLLPIPIVSPPDAMPPRPLQVYHRRPRVVAPLPFPEAPADSLPIPSASPAPALPSPNDLPIAVRKGTRSTRNPHPIYNFLSYHRLSSPYSAFVSAISSVSLPKSTHEALSHPGWRQAMVDEMAALHSNGTWDLVVLPSGKSTVGCRWVYAVKVGPDGQVDRLKARLVAKGYTQVYGSDYGDTFSPVAKIASVRLLLSMAAMCSWPLYQLDIKNAFLHGDLAEEVYMEQPPGFVAQGESGLVCRLRRSLYGLKQSPRAWFSRFSSVVQEFGMLRSTADHSVFYHHNSLGQCIYLVVYVDDIVITGSDQDGIQKLKQHLFTHFQTKDLGKLKYFLGIEIAQSSSGVVLSQRKYALDILEETGMLDCKPVDTPMDPNVKLVPGQGEPLGDPGRYRRLVGKLNYLTITRPDISFPVSVVSQFLQSPCDSHWDAVIRILRYIKSTPGQGVLYENRGHTQVVGYTDADWAGSPTDRRSTSGYCVFIGGNLISWKSKKQDVVARSSAEAEYRAMALATCELIWLRHLLQELRFGKDEQMKLICDNQAALHIASNPVFHERTKHIEVDCHFIREKIASGCVATSFVNSNDQLADIFTKSLRGLLAFCYSSETHRYFFSADVTFFEDSPFSPPLSSLPVSKVLPFPIISPPDAVPSRPLQVSSSSSSCSCRYSSFFGRVGCRWVYTVKVGPDGQVDRLKARLVAKGYTQLDIKNAFLHGILLRKFIWSNHLVLLLRGEFGMFRSTSDHSVFFYHNSSGQCIYLTKDLGKLKYFLGIEIAQSSSGVVLSQRKYALDILEETGMLDCKPVDTPMDPNVKLIPGQGEPLGDPGRYRRLVGKLNYLTITRPTFLFLTPGQGVLYENRGHTQVVGYTDADWADSPTDRRSTSGFSAEIEYRAMTLATCELIWLKHLLRELRFGKDEQMKLICDNKPLCILHPIQSSMKGPNTLKLTVTSLERRSHQDVWRLVLSIQMIN